MQLPKSHPDYIRYKKKDQTPTSSSESKDNKTENEKKDPENPTLGSQEEKIQNESTEKNIETRKRAREEEGFLSKLAGLDFIFGLKQTKGKICVFFFKIKVFLLFNLTF